MLVIVVLTSTVKTNLQRDKFVQDKIGPDELLKKVSDLLNHFSSFSYDYSYEAKYFSENDSFYAEAKIYLDYGREDSLVGFSCQMESKTAKFIFNGSELFFLNKTKKIISVYPNPPKKDFNSILFFSNSIVTLKNAIPLIIADKELKKTIYDSTIKSRPVYIVSFTPKKKVIDPLGKSYTLMTIERDLTYKIIIDKESYLPMAIIQTFSDITDFQKTEFSNIKEVEKPLESSWYYSTYSKDFTLELPKDEPKLIAQNAIAPNWELPVLNEVKATVSLNKLKGKLILLEFWIKNCGYCIEVVPKLNELWSKYERKDLQIFGINAYDSRERINSFCSKNNPNYKILYGGESTVAEYGVFGFPTIVLIDRNGKVIYSGTFDKSRIEGLIEKAL
jgi:thiol-disulfide isomerase/thioredoxin